MPPAATSTAAVLADTLVADAFRSLFGSRRGATRSFRRHHTSEISSAIVYADAETLLAHAEGAPV